MINQLIYVLYNPYRDFLDRLQFSLIDWLNIVNDVSYSKIEKGVNTVWSCWQIMWPIKPGVNVTKYPGRKLWNYDEH